MPRTAGADAGDSARRVGTGFTADILAHGDGRVLKLFHAGTPADVAERELAVTRAVHAAGAPAPEAHERVDVNGRPGIVLELIDGPSLLARFERRPWDLFAGARQLAELHAALHMLPAPAELPPQRERVRRMLERAAGTHGGDALSALERLPAGTTLCHGDFHPGNILLSARGPIVIDWSTACAGDPAGDVAATVRLFRHARLPDTTPAHVRAITYLARSLLCRAYVTRYLELRPVTRRAIDAWCEVLERVPVVMRGP